jgi:DNA-binding response OmpR family regulator
MAATSPLAGKRMLIVEDDFLIGTSLSRVLASQGCQIEGPVFTVRDAIRIVEQRSLDGALLDLKLQDGFAIDIARHLRRKRVPFVVVTAYQREDLHPELRGAFYIGKPALPDVVIQVVTAALHAR